MIRDASHVDARAGVLSQCAVAGGARRVILPRVLQGLRLTGDLLEVGAGSGAMAAGTAASFPGLRLTVTDMDPATVRALQQRLDDQTNVSVEQADVTSLRFADQSFDFVASYLMLHHVLDWQRALAEPRACCDREAPSSATT